MHVVGGYAKVEILAWTDIRRPRLSRPLWRSVPLSDTLSLTPNILRLYSHLH